MWRVLLVSWVVAVVVGCERDAPPASPPPVPAPIAKAKPPPPPRHFVGSKACGDCHEDELAAWKKDWHSRALSPATPASVAGKFDAHFKGTSSEAWMSRKGERFFMKTRSAEGKDETFPIDWVIGGKRMQDTTTTFPDGRWQVLPIYFHVTGHGAWVDYSETKQGALSPDHPFFWANFRRTANRECLDCHVSGAEISYDRSSHRWSTAFADAGVACESCHGPGSVHADSQDEADVVRPSALPADRAMAICASCHGPRNPLFPLLDAAHRFQPGDAYDDFYQALVVVDGQERSGDFFADGRPKTSSYEYQALIQSPCSLKGKATCLTCHTAPHDEHRGAELRLTLAGTKTPGTVDEVSCKGCHARVFAEGRAHTRHASKDAQSCLSCHMPKTVTGVLDTFADHAISVPVPQNSGEHEVPNACGTCHRDRTSAQLSAQLAKLWPNAAARQQRRLRLADAIDEKTADRSRPALEQVIADVNEAPTLRATAASLLAQRFPRDASATIAPLLHSSEPLLRAKGAEALGLIRDRSTFSAIAALGADSSLTVRLAAGVALSFDGDARGERILRALTSEPRSSALPLPHVLLGYAAAKRGDLRTAIDEVERGLALQPFQAPTLVLAADLHARVGELSIARERLEEALRIDPANAPGEVAPRAPRPSPAGGKPPMRLVEATPAQKQARDLPHPPRVGQVAHPGAVPGPRGAPPHPPLEPLGDDHLALGRRRRRAALLLRDVPLREHARRRARSRLCDRERVHRARPARPRPCDRDAHRALHHGPRARLPRPGARPLLRRRRRDLPPRGLPRDRRARPLAPAGPG